jgi:hypothetical protein
LGHFDIVTYTPGFDGSPASSARSLCARRRDLDDEIRAAFVFGAVPVHLAGLLGHEGALRNPGRMRGIDHVSGAAPGCAVDDQDVAVVRMVVRFAEFAGHERVDVDEQAAGPSRIAEQHRIVRRLHAWIAPFELVGRLDLHRLGVELRRRRGGE